MATKTKTTTTKAVKSQSMSMNKTACNATPKPLNCASTKPIPKTSAKPADKPLTRSIQFSYYAPEAHQVSLVGDFNNWKTDSCRLLRANNGEWTASLSLKPGVYDYRFFVDGEWRDDPRSAQKILNSFGTQNARIIVK